MTYQTVAFISQMTAMAIFGTVLAGVLIYAFWPGNKSRFERAANRPLETDDAPLPHVQGDRNG
jgi:cytochrome c oxidase cbb3-type subunit 4